MQANGSLPVIPLYLPVPPVMIWVPQFICGCDLSVSRVSKVEKIWSPSLSVNTQAPSMYFFSPEATLNAAHRADILSSIFSPFMFCVVPTASRLVAVPRPGMSMLIRGRKMKCVTYGVVPFLPIGSPRSTPGAKPRSTPERSATLPRLVTVGAAILLSFIGFIESSYRAQNRQANLQVSCLRMPTDPLVRLFFGSGERA